MRPYLAIIKDSFREAFHSRVLWIVLVIITLFLLLVAPVSYRQTLTATVFEQEVNWNSLAEQLGKASRGEGTKAQQRIWSLMSSRGQNAVASYKPLRSIEQAAQIDMMLEDLTSIIKQDDLYQSQVFTLASLRQEGKDLARREKSLTQEERWRLNRLLLEATFGEALATSPSTSLQFHAVITDLGSPLPLSKAMLVEVFRQGLPWFVDKGLLAIGLLIAIIVTAPAIPHMFDPGSLHLLLSKPASRSMLYLSKFCGSCAFVLLCATYLFVGVFLILGTRWDMWQPRLLWCIPIYTFVFAVYYSVAALAALFWRNVIVSILVAIMFWAVCWGVGVTKFWFDATFDLYRAKKVVAVGDTVVMVDTFNTPQVWNPQDKTWQIALLSKELREHRAANMFMPLPRIEGPVYDPQQKRTISLMVSASTGQQLLATSQAEDRFAYHEGPPSPFSPLKLLNDPDGRPILITASGIYRVEGDLTAKQQEVKFMGYRIPLTGSKGPLQEAGPKPAQNWDDPFAAAFAADGTLFVYSGSKLQRLTKGENGAFMVQESEKLEQKKERRAWLAAGKSVLVLAHRNGELQLRDPNTLKLRKTIQPVAGDALVSVTNSPDGRWIAALYRGNKLWIMEDGQEQFKLAPVTGQGDISAASFTPDGRLLVADQVDRVTEYEPGSWQRTQRFSPRMTLSTSTYRYLVQPIYFVCPKPGEFYKTVQHVLHNPANSAQTAEENETPGTPDVEPESQAIKNPWQPVYSSFAFMCVMLAIGCLYMERQEF